MEFPERLTALQPFFGSWLLDSLLGEGSYGKVYRIKREEMGETTYAALKWIFLPKSQTELDEYRAENLTEEALRTLYRETVRQFREEIVLMNKLRGNSHIVNYEDHLIVERKDEIGWDILIRMELLTPLTKRFRDGMTVGDVVKLGLDLCDGLSLCAKAKIIHRDIKADNIFITPYGDFKLGDFGVARSLERTVTHMSRQGTPLYMAPEVYMNKGTYDATVDLYSLALVMHRLLNRQRLPFLSMTDAVPTHAERNAALETRLNGVPLPPPVDGGVELAKVICKAASFDPRKRYQEPEQMQAALQYAAAKINLRQPLTANPTGAGLNSGRSSLNAASAVPRVRSERKPAGENGKAITTGAQQSNRGHNGWRNALVIGVVLFALTSIGFGLWQNQQQTRVKNTLANLSTPLREGVADSTVATLTPETVAQTVTPGMQTNMPAGLVDDEAILQSAVCKALGLAQGTMVTNEQAARVTELDVQFCGLTDISYLQKCTGLQTLNLSNNRIQDLTPLTQLKALKTLRLWNNNIKYPSALINLTELQTLDLGCNALGDVSTLAYLPKLQWLRLSYNQISNIDSLSTLKELTFLGAGHNVISDITVLSSMTKLQEVWLVSNQIHSVEPLASLKSLQKLSIALNPVDSYKPLATIHSLTTCDVDLKKYKASKATPVAEKTLAPTTKPTSTPQTSAKTDTTDKTEAAVRKAIGLTGSMELTKEFAERITVLSLNKGELTDLSYLQNFPNLKTLSLNENTISDISPLKGLVKLKELSIYLNSITDITPLKNLTNLETLDLGDNRVKDLSPLQNLTKLKVLWMGNNTVSDLSPLESLTDLVELHLYGNTIKDVTVLKNLTKLKKLSLLGNPIKDYSPLAALDQLTECDVSTWISLSDAGKVKAASAKLVEKAVRNAISLPAGVELTDSVISKITELDLSAQGLTDILYLKKLKNLESLNLDNNSIHDVSALSQLTGLTSLYLNTTGIKDISPLQNLTKLQVLYIDSNQISDITALGNLTQLNSLNISHNIIQDISPLEKLTALQCLLMSDNKIQDISPLRNLDRLYELVMDHNFIGDLSPISTLSSLTTLFAAQNAIVDVAALNQLTSLRRLSISDNLIADLSPLIKLTNLDSLDVDGNMTTDILTLDKTTHEVVMSQKSPLLETETPVIPSGKSTAVVDNDTIIQNEICKVLELAQGTPITNEQAASVIYLNLPSCGLTDISYLQRCTGLQSLDLSSNKIEDLTPLSNLNSLSLLNIYDNQSLSDISALENLHNITFLVLEYNAIRDLSPLRKLTHLNTLVVTHSSISDLTPLEKLTNLQTLFLESNKILDVAPLRNLKKLKQLSLGSNFISDISPLSALTALQSLYMNSNNIVDLSPLKKLSGLVELDISGNLIRDFSPLENLSNLNCLDISDNLTTNILSIDQNIITEMPDDALSN